MLYLLQMIMVSLQSRSFPQLNFVKHLFLFTANDSPRFFIQNKSIVRYVPRMYMIVGDYRWIIIAYLSLPVSGKMAQKHIISLLFGLKRIYILIWVYWFCYAVYDAQIDVYNICICKDRKMSIYIYG